MTRIPERVDLPQAGIYNPAMAVKRNIISCCLAMLVLSLWACGGEAEPEGAAPGEAATAVPTTPALENLVHEFPQGSELLESDDGGSLRNPVLVATGQGFSWGALVTREGEITWVVDGETTSIGDVEISEFTSNADLSRFAYVSDDVVVADGEPVEHAVVYAEHGEISCCPTFSGDGSTFGYIANASFVAVDDVPQEAHPDGVTRLALSPDGTRSAYVVGGSMVVLDGEQQQRYDSVSALTFSADGAHFAYIADGEALVVDGEESQTGESVGDLIVLSSDGSQLAYVKGDLQRGRIFWGESEQKGHSFGCSAGFAAWSCATFTADGSSLAYTTPMLSENVGAGAQLLQSRVVRDGVREPFSLSCCLVPGPEGSHLAYVSSGPVVVVDGIPLEVPGLPAGLTPADLAFSADGKSLGFLLYEPFIMPSSITKLYLDTVDVP